MSIHPDVLLEMEAAYYYHMVRYRSWKSHCSGEYQKLISKKS